MKRIVRRSRNAPAGRQSSGSDADFRPLRASNRELLNVRIQQQNRQTLAMKVTPDGVVLLLPHGLDADSSRVQAFIKAGLQKLKPPQPLAPSERFTQEGLKGLVAAWSERIGVTVKRVQIRAMRNKWASCSSNGTLTLSADLLRLPRDLVEYVVCHELVHLKVPHHGEGFRALMGCYMPDWQERERHLAGWIERMDYGNGKE